MKKENEPIVIVKAKGINPKEKTRDNKNQNSKMTEIQGKNINGNYGRIYVQEGGKKNLVYSEFDAPKTSNKIKLRGEENNSKTYTKINSNTMKKNKERQEGKNRSSQLRRKSIDRGGDYKNIQVTHIINSAMDIDFHIIDPLEVVTDEKKKAYRKFLNKSNRNGKNGKVKVTCSCSCDNIKIIPKEKKKDIVKTEVLSHRENPHLKRVNKEKIDNKVNKTMVGTSQRYNRHVNKNQKK